MRSMSKMIALAVAGLLVLSGAAIADESVDAQLQELSDRMTELEGELDSANATVAAQDLMIREATLDEERQGSNALSPFIEATEISAWIAASYNINFRNPDKTGARTTAPPAAPDLSTGTTNQGMFNGLYNPNYPESNTVQFDQAWIGINKAPTDESRAGYNLDLVMGQANNGMAGITGVGVFAGSASYMMPIMDGFIVEGGLLTTAQGAEVLQTNANLNITRGITWGTQPVTNMGVTGTLDLGGGLSVMAGMLNNSSTVDPTDSNNNKALTSRVNYSADKFSIGAGVNWGKNEGPGNSNTDHLLLNVLASVDPTDNLTAYVDYTLNNRKGPDTMMHSISVATRLAVLDSTGIAVRGEVVLDGDGFLTGAADSTLYTITGTIDHALTDNLTAKVEVKYDGTSDEVGGGFWNEAGTALTEDGQTLFIAQLVYEF